MFVKSRWAEAKHAMNAEPLVVDYYRIRITAVIYLTRNSYRQGVASKEDRKTRRP